MFIRTCLLAICLSLSLGARAAELPTASSDDLLKVYTQLRSLHGSTQWGVADNVVWKRDAATFKFTTGRLALAAPVGGRVVAAYFDGNASVEVDAPTSELQRQLARFAGGPAFKDDFEKSGLLFHRRFCQSVGTVAEYPEGR